MTIESADRLEEIGLTKYEAKIYATLVSHGPSGVSDINRLSGIPRNKVYEMVDILVKRGIVEVQPGRPVIFRAVPPKLVISQFLEDYNRKANEALNLLLREEASNQDSTIENVWLMSGSRAIKKRLADEILRAKKSFFAIEAYPPEFLLAVKSVLKSADERGVKIRAVSVVNPTSRNVMPIADRNLIEYRVIKLSDLKKMAMQQGGEAFEPFRQMSRIGGSYIIDNIRVLDIVRNEQNLQKITGILSEVPAIPALQRIAIEGFINKYTKPL